MRLATALTFEAYVTEEGWRAARLSSCPTCDGAVTSLGAYVRKLPKPARVARFYCRQCGMTISLLPDFYASRTPGLLEDIEEAVAVAESARSVEEAADRVRPAEDADAVTITSALRWLGRRVAAVHRVLGTIIGLLPSQFEGCASTIVSFRKRLGTNKVLVALRGICARYLGMLAAPLGLVGGPAGSVRAPRRRQQSMGPDPPAAFP